MRDVSASMWDLNWGCPAPETGALRTPLGKNQLLKLFLFSTWENRSPRAVSCAWTHNLSIGKISLLQCARHRGKERPFGGAQRHLGDRSLTRLRQKLVSQVKVAVGIRRGPESLLLREEWPLRGGDWERGGCSRKADTGTPHMTSQGDPPPQFLSPLRESPSFCRARKPGPCHVPAR